MNDVDKVLDREDMLGNWRTATLLAFNGFVISALSSNTQADTFFQSVLPLLGLLITLSVFVSSLISLEKKVKALFGTNGTGTIGYITCQVVGPYIFSSVLLLIFWFLYIANYFGICFQVC